VGWHWGSRAREEAVCSKLSIPWPFNIHQVARKSGASPEYCIDRPFGFLLAADELQVKVILGFHNKMLTGFLAFVYDNYSFG